MEQRKFQTKQRALQIPIQAFSQIESKNFQRFVRDVYVGRSRCVATTLENWISYLPLGDLRFIVARSGAYSTRWTSAKQTSVARPELFVRAQWQIIISWKRNWGFLRTILSQLPEHAHHTPSNTWSAKKNHNHTKKEKKKKQSTKRKQSPIKCHRHGHTTLPPVDKCSVCTITNVEWS